MRANVDNADVVVWGGGTGGVAAAIQAARSGVQTLLLTPGAWLGGMVSAAGVCCPDGNELTPWQTGLWGAFLRTLEQAEPSGLDHNWVSCFGYRPITAETVLQCWVLEESRLLWWPCCRLLDVERDGSRISALQLECAGERRRVMGSVVIDGSDRGDLLPLAEAPYRFGWEAKEDWNEPSAPSRARLEGDPFFRDQALQSATWVVMGQLPKDAIPKVGAAAQTRQDSPVLPPPFTQSCAAFGLERTLTYGRLPGGLVMLNWPLHGNDWHEGLERGFSGHPGHEAELYADMQAHSLQFAEALGSASRGQLSLGMAFPESSGAPAPWLAPMPYWREGRRLVGQSTVLETDLLPTRAGQAIARLPLSPTGELQSIAVGNYANDHHYPGEDWPLAAKSCRWGGRWTGTPFCVPYGALVSESVVNLLAADKAISTSHMANGATRLQPLVMNVGQAAGLAAALAVRRGCEPADLAVGELQRALICETRAPSAVAPLWNTPWHHPQWRERQLQALDHPLAAIRVDRNQQDSHPADVNSVVHSPQAQQWRGWIEPEEHGTVRLHCNDGQSWPLITLEPSMHQWLGQVERKQATQVIATANPWGPWLRVSGLAT
ncbi:MAG: FAD-dependent oxidoreductase [Synechococcus sp.]